MGRYNWKVHLKEEPEEVQVVVNVDDGDAKVKKTFFDFIRIKSEKLYAFIKKQWIFYMMQMTLERYITNSMAFSVD